MRKAAPVLLLFVFTLAGCGERVPVEVQQAMTKQAEELKQIRTNYESAVDILFAQIRVLQLSILEEKEKQIRQKYTIGRRVLADGQIAYYDREGNPFPPTGDPDKDIIPVNLNKRITDTFEQLRQDSAEKLDQAKQEFLKLDNNIEVAQQINAAVADYITSLVNARNAQRELGTTLLTRLGSIPTAGNLSGRLLNLIVPDTTPLNTLQPSNP